MAEVRPPSLAEAEAYAELLWQSFGLGPAFCEALVDSHAPDCVRVVVEDGRVRGGLLIDPQGQAWGGRVVPVACIGGVAVDPVHRRRGWASRLLTATLREARANGSVLAVLHASNHAVYRRLGFEHAGQRWVVSVAPRDLTGDPRAARVERLDADAEPELRDLYAEWVLPHREGALDRSALRWERATCTDRPGSVWWAGVRGATGALDGYATWVVEGRAPEVVARVGDFVARTPQAVSALCGTLAQLEATVARIEVATAPDDPLWWNVAHPRARTVSADAFLIRVLDPSAAVARMLRPRRDAPGIGLDWADPLFPAEAGSVRLTVHGGRARWTANDTPGPPIGPRALAALLTGRLGPAEVRSHGLAALPASLDTAVAEWCPRRSVWLRDMF